MGKRKKPKVKEEPFPQKKPQIASNPLDYYHHHPSWRISKIQVIDPFGWHILEQNKLDEIRIKLANFESMTWREILLDSKKQNHTVSVFKKCQFSCRGCQLEHSLIDALSFLEFSYYF